METSDSAVSRVWFITGASRGLGRAFTEAALAAGDRVAGAARDVSPLKELADRYDGRLLALTLDVTDRAGVFEVVAQAVQHFGQLDIVVNNAGALAAGMVEEFTEAEARAQLDLNFFGALWVSQAVLPHLRRQGSGHVVQISSIGALGGFPSTGLYSASKFALEGMSEALAAEAAQFGVKVTIVQPGGYWTDLYTSSTATVANPVYDPLRKELEAQWAEGSIDSEPSLAADAVTKLVDSHDPPLRLLLGSMVYDLAFDISRRRMDTWAGWEEVSRAAEKAVPAPAAEEQLVIRPISGPEEIELFNTLDYTINHELADDLANGHRRPGWMWVALRNDQVLARVAWWGRPGEDNPLSLDIFDLDVAELDAARSLFTTAFAAVVPAGAERPEYGRFVPADWRDDAGTRAAVDARMAILADTGAQLTVERLRLEWTPGTPLPADDPRLAFRPVDDIDELIDLMTRALEGTLDYHSQADLAGMTAREAAVRQYREEFDTFTSPRDWWRIATSRDTGEPVGFVIAARNTYNPIIAYLGVLPEHRGQGYVDGILAEGTRVLAANDVPRIRAATDLDNVPMAKAFTRAGYVNFERAINMAWST